MINNNSANQDRALYTIGVASQLTNTTVYTLRMYEEKGLILPHKTATGRRMYSDTDIRRLKCIRHHLDEEGLNIAGIKALLALVPCWIIKPCTVEDRQACDAYSSTLIPCWAASEKGPKCRDEDCRVCNVYQLSDECSDVKSYYKNLLADFKQ